jgi:transposase-like protein
MSSACPQCQSKAYKRNGYTRHGKQNNRCLSCGKQFSSEPYTFDTIQDVDTSAVVETACTFDPHQV